MKQSIEIKKSWLICDNGFFSFPVVIFLLILFSRDTFLFGTNANKYITFIPIGVMGIYVLFEFISQIKREKYRKKRGIIIAGAVMLAVYIALSLYHQEFVSIMVLRFLCILSAMLLTLHYDFNEFAEAFVKVMVLFAMAALILEVIVYAFRSVVPMLPQMYNSAGNYIINIGLAGVVSYELNSTLIRAFGVFWEPGVFQIYLNLAILFELFAKQKPNWRHVILFVLGIMITFSTAGYIIVVGIFVLYCLFYGNINKKMLVIVLFLVGIAAFALLFLDLTIIEQKVFGKLFNSESGSTIARQASVFVNIKIFFDHPLLGIGMRNIEDEFIKLSAQMFPRMSKHNTNTLLYQFAAQGVVVGGIFTFGTYKFTYYLAKKKTLILCLFVILLLLYVGENLKYSIIPFSLMFYGIGISRSERTKRGIL